MLTQIFSFESERAVQMETGLLSCKHMNVTRSFGEQQESQKETENPGKMRASLKKGFTAGCLRCFHFHAM